MPVADSRACTRGPAANSEIDKPAQRYCSFRELGLVRNKRGLVSQAARHACKLITYLSALDARVAVWIVSEPRPEHTKAITWLNESRQASFYLVKAEAICIDNSAPACLFTLITGPSEETREAGETKQEFADRYAIRRHFWETPLERARQKTKLYSTLSPTNGNWISFASGRPGLSFQNSITQHGATTQLVIDRGKDADAENRAVFDQLKSHKADIEQKFGAPLEWYEPE